MSGIHPYRQLDERAFWRDAVAGRPPLEIDGLWKPKAVFEPSHGIATAGSCFAQHISKAFVRNGFRWLDGEPAPKNAPASLAAAYQYGVFSFRTGNIYTAAALSQWVKWSFGKEPPPDECWASDGRFFDPFRPAIEPGGFASAAEMHRSREGSLSAMRRVLTEADRFVFTLGLTEAWRCTETGTVYPMCPGTAAGEFDAERHAFVNFRASEIARSLSETFDLLRAHNPGLRFLLTVSPVPLVATASGEHVLVATSHSKSILRAVAGELAADRPDTDYFPSYELITGTPFRGRFFADDLRSVSAEGVDFAMASFFGALSGGGRPTVDPSRAPPGDFASAEADDDELVCEEEMLKAFGPGS